MEWRAVYTHSVREPKAPPVLHIRLTSEIEKRCMLALMAKPADVRLTTISVCWRTTSQLGKPAIGFR